MDVSALVDATQRRLKASDMWSWLSYSSHLQQVKPLELVSRYMDWRRAISSAPHLTHWHLPEFPTRRITNIMKWSFYTTTFEVIGYIALDGQNGGNIV